MVLHLLINERININKNGLIRWYLFAFHKNSLVTITQHLSGHALEEFVSMFKSFQDSMKQRKLEILTCVHKFNYKGLQLNNPTTVLMRQMTLQG